MPKEMRFCRSCGNAREGPAEYQRRSGFRARPPNSEAQAHPFYPTFNAPMATLILAAAATHGICRYDVDVDRAGGFLWHGGIMSLARKESYFGADDHVWIKPVVLV